MQATVDVLKAAATSAVIFRTISDEPPDEFKSGGLPAFVTHEYTGEPHGITTTVYEGTIDYPCYVIANSKEDWSTAESYIDTYMTTLLARSEAKAAAYRLVPPYRRYLMQIGTFKCRVIEFRIRAPFNKEYA